MSKLLVLNPKGLDRALKVEIDEINVVVCASNTFSRRNQGVPTDEAMANALAVTSIAEKQGRFTTFTLAAAFGCPFEGEIEPKRVIALAQLAIRARIDELCLADTIGVGAPSQVRMFIDSLANELAGTQTALRFHFHNTRNTGIANALAAIESGVGTLDASAGGIGGCPFAPRATGNIPTDDLVYLLDRMGISTGISLAKLLPIADFLSSHLGHQVPAMVPRAGVFPPG